MGNFLFCFPEEQFSQLYTEYVETTPRKKVFVPDLAIKSTSGTTSTSHFPCRILLNTALVPNFPFEPQFSNADIGTFMYSR